MNIYVPHGNYIVNSKGSYKVAWKLKGLPHERGWVKSAENLGASPFKRDLSIETTFRQVHLAGQSLLTKLQISLRLKIRIELSSYLNISIWCVSDGRGRQDPQHGL
jgi:hypothetical protein